MGMFQRKDVQPLPEEEALRLPHAAAMAKKQILQIFTWRYPLVATVTGNEMYLQEEILCPAG